MHSHTLQTYGPSRAHAAWRRRRSARALFARLYGDDIALSRHELATAAREHGSAKSCCPAAVMLPFCATAAGPAVASDLTRRLPALAHPDPPPQSQCEGRSEDLRETKHAPLRQRRRARHRLCRRRRKSSRRHPIMLGRARRCRTRVSNLPGHVGLRVAEATGWRHPPLWRRPRRAWSQLTSHEQ